MEHSEKIRRAFKECQQLHREGKTDFEIEQYNYIHFGLGHRASVHMYKMILLVEKQEKMKERYKESINPTPSIDQQQP